MCRRLLDPRLRKALIYGINRQEIVDGLVGRNASQVAHSILLSNEEIFQEGEATAVKYEYDPRRAADLIEQLLADQKARRRNGTHILYAAQAV